MRNASFCSAPALEDGEYATNSTPSKSAAGEPLLRLVVGYHPNSSNSWQDDAEILTYIVAKTFDWVGPDAIEYLMENPDIAQELLDAHETLMQAFGANTTYALRRVFDPERTGVQDGPVAELCCYINSGLPLEECSAALDRFDEEWYLERSSRLVGRLTFDIAF